MPTSLEARLRTAAAAFPGLTALLGSSPFRWYDTQLAQDSAFPAITVLLVSDVLMYSLQGILQTSWSRVQFTIWDIDPESARNVEAELMLFLAQFNGDGVMISFSPPVCKNFILTRRSGFYAQTQPPNYWRTVDAKIFNNSSL